MAMDAELKLCYILHVTNDKEEDMHGLVKTKSSVYLGMGKLA